jgi:hypothetical protein
MSPRAGGIVLGTRGLLAGAFVDPIRSTLQYERELECGASIPEER